METVVYPHISCQHYTIYPKKYAHGFVVLCFVVVMQSFIMNSHEVFIHIHQGCFAGTGTIARLPQCQWSKPDGYGKICQCITTTKHSKAKTVCIFLGIYCTDVIMSIMASQITSLAIVYSPICSDTDQRKHQSSASLAFVRGIHRRPVNSLHKRPVTRKMFQFDDVILNLSSQLSACPQYISIIS